MNAHVPHQTLVTPEKPRALASGQFKVTARDVDVYYGEKQAIKNANENRIGKTNSSEIFLSRAD